MDVGPLLGLSVTPATCPVLFAVMRGSMVLNPAGFR